MELAAHTGREQAAGVHRFLLAEADLGDGVSKSLSAVLDISAFLGWVLTFVVEIGVRRIERRTLAEAVQIYDTDGLKAGVLLAKVGTRLSEVPIKKMA